MTRSELPQPDDLALAHSERLQELIRQEIAKYNGSLPFIRFMEMALYTPGLGYYSAGASKLGTSGDFVTAPEISSLFSRCLARQCHEILQKLNGSGAILEIGAGSGIMAADIIQQLADCNSLPEQYLILEPSADLRQRQQQTLQQHIPHYVHRVDWLNRLPEDGFRGVMLANEVLDALPVQRFRITAQDPQALHVTLSSDGKCFAWCNATADQDLVSFVTHLQQRLGDRLPLDYESEYNPQLSGWMQALADCLTQGVILLIDYGYPQHEYYHSQRRQGTLVCHYRHRLHDDPLLLVGLQDISSSVDFTALAQAGTMAGLELIGYTSQHYFLFGCGLEHLLAEIDPADTKSYLELSRQVKLLTLPGEMGERCKVMGLSRDISAPLCGFSFFDEQQRL